MLPMSSAYTRSDGASSTHASGLGCFPLGPHDLSYLSSYIDDASLCDLRSPLFFPTEHDSRFLLLDPHQVLRGDPNLFCPFEDTYSSSLCQSWPDEPFPGGWLSEMESAPSPPAGEAPIATSARSCSPASDSSTLSDVSFGPDWCFPQPSAPSAGPSQVAAEVPPVPLPVPSAAGPIRRGRGRPRKDAPPVHQPPPLCTYIDPLSGAPCNKLLNRHHDLPRHMFKHCQDEAALVNSGRLERERATLLPPDWKENDELKLPCRFCNQRFSRADAVKRHEKKEHKHRPRKG